MVNLQAFSHNRMILANTNNLDVLVQKRPFLVELKSNETTKMC